MTNAVNIAQSGTNNVTMRNRIINGAMVIDQRNAGASVTPTTNETYTLDRWSAFLSSASKYSVQRSSVAPAGFTNSALITSLSAYSVPSGEFYAFRQVIEGYNTADLMWGTANAQTVTLSFWVRSSLTGTFGASVSNNGARSYPFTYTISAANTWEQKTITIPGDTTGTWNTTNGIGIQLWFGLGVGSTWSGTAGSWGSGYFLSATGATSVVGTNGATWYVTGVQLEAGTAASPFENRLYGTELQLCERYYSKQSTTGSGGGQGDFASGIQTSTTAGVAYIKFATKMRAAPTVTFSNILATDHNSYQTAATLGSVGQGFDATYLAYQTAANGAQYRPQLLATNLNTLGFIDFSAEL